MKTKPIAAVIRDYADHLMEIPGVVGISQGMLKGQPCIQLLVESQTPPTPDRLPLTLEGYPVVMKATGPIQAGGSW